MQLCTQAALYQLAPDIVVAVGNLFPLAHVGDAIGPDAHPYRRQYLVGIDIDNDAELGDLADLHPLERNRGADLEALYRAVEHHQQRLRVAIEYITAEVEQGGKENQCGAGHKAADGQCIRRFAHAVPPSVWLPPRARNRRTFSLSLFSTRSFGSP